MHVVESLATGYQLQGCSTSIIQARRASDTPFPVPSEADVLMAQREVQSRDETKRLVELKEAQTAARVAEEKEEQERRRLEAEANKRLGREILLCHALYRSTFNKKISDLTVNEEQQIRACQTVELYK
jgi:hypothetical protein